MPVTIEDLQERAHELGIMCVNRLGHGHEITVRTLQIAEDLEAEGREPMPWKAKVHCRVCSTKKVIPLEFEKRKGVVQWTCICHHGELRPHTVEICVRRDEAFPKRG